MDPTEVSGGVAAVYILGVAGSLAALGFLWLEYRRRSSWSAAASAILAVVWSAAALGGWWWGTARWAWAACLVLGTACGIAFLLHWPRARNVLASLARPRTVWIVMLVAAPASASLLAWRLNRPDNAPFDPLLLPMERKEIRQVHVATDRGRLLPVFSLVVPDTAQQYEQAYLAERQFSWRIIRTGDPDPTYNCHGWVFTAGRFALRSEDVEAILEDNQYEKVDEPQPGDLIVYRDDEGRVLHTGLVRSVIANEIVLIESKWGPLGRFLHGPEDQPWGENCAYYRSPRPGHLLPVIEDAAPPQSSLAEKSSDAPSTKGL